MIRATLRRLLPAVVLAFSTVVHAQAPVPALTGHVVDQADLLDAATEASLEQKLAGFESRKGSQVAVLVVRTTSPEPIEAYAIRVAEQWKLGRRKVDDGAILVVAKDDRALRIEVGYGLEGVLNDATSKRIIDEVIVPRFLQQDFAGGITAGVDRMLRVIDGEPLPEPQWRQDAQRGSGLSSYLPALVVVVLVVGGALRSMFGRLPGAAATGGLVGVVVWWLAGALSTALAAGLAAAFFTLFGGMGLLRTGGVRGGFGGFGGGGGRSGGGFSGGGGGFGGGGASGRW
jgi:uncharacterized protein